VTTSRSTPTVPDDTPRGPTAPRHLAKLGEDLDGPVAEEIERRAKGARRIAILGHEHPDGDCVGSTVALCAMLRGLGRTADVYFAEPTPPRYAFLDPEHFLKQLKRGQRISADLVFVLDTTDYERLGGVKPRQFEGPPIINLDHHISNDHFGTVNWVAPGAAAAGEIVWRLAAARGWEASPTALNALYVALVTDTGMFSYSNTSPRVMRMAAELVEAGVDPETMWRRIYLDRTPGELELEARARASFEVWAGGRIATVGVTYQDFVDTKTTPAASQEFANIPRSLEGCDLAIFFYEIEEGMETKISIRSQRGINACALAQQFGGGGHRQAAGCRVNVPLAAAKRLFRPAAEAALHAKPKGSPKTT
jgi:phosphoesterase RecJ-like protein